jgi:hypothetical protein
VQQVSLLHQKADGVRLGSGHVMAEADRHLGFAVGSHDRDRPPLTDTILTLSTYLGGGGNDHPAAIAPATPRNS